jgi:hypothetical protein
VKPGTIVKVVGNNQEKNNIRVLVGDLNSQAFIWPVHKKVKNGSIGFITKCSSTPMFSWAIEVAFPDSDVLGWVDKKYVSPLTSP